LSIQFEFLTLSLRFQILKKSAFELWICYKSIINYDKVFIVFNIVLKYSWVSHFGCSVAIGVHGTSCVIAVLFALIIMDSFYYMTRRFDELHPHIPWCDSIYVSLIITFCDLALRFSRSSFHFLTSKDEKLKRFVEFYMSE
jgi:NADH:ubiquinone oxidoreductase subunit 4 (subunit M)